jgi:hypothetical protein
MTEKLGDAQHHGDWYTHTPSSARPTQLQWLLLCQASVSETRKKDVTIPPRSARDTREHHHRQWPCHQTVVPRSAYPSEPLHQTKTPTRVHDHLQLGRNVMMARGQPALRPLFGGLWHASGSDSTVVVTVAAARAGAANLQTASACLRTEPSPASSICSRRGPEEGTA